MKILIDADGCPVINNTIEIAKAYDIRVTLVCDTAHMYDNDYASIVIVSKGVDSADFAIVNKVDVGDIVITQDYGLAAMCLSRKAFVLNQNGFVYDDSNIDMMLMKRHASKRLRLAGRGCSVHRKRRRTDDVKFEQCLSDVIKAHI